MNAIMKLIETHLKEGKAGVESEGRDCGLRSLQIVDALWRQPDIRKLGQVLELASDTRECAAEHHIAERVKEIVAEYKDQIQRTEGQLF